MEKRSKNASNETDAIAAANAKGDPLRRLRIAYIAALLFIALLTSASHTLIAGVTENQRDNVEITYTISKIRSLADLIIAEAAAFQKSGDDFDDKRLTTSLNEMNAYIAMVDAQPGSAFNKLFNSEQFLLKKKMETFVFTAGEVAHNKRINNDAQADEMMILLKDRIAKILSINLDLALDRYQSTIVAQAEDSQRLQNLGAVSVLIVLLLEALFIFRPLINKIEAYHKDLKRLALTDALTGLSNRRAFMKLANAALDHFHRHKKPFAVVLCDLDKFKSVNDSYGHKVGDIVLQHFSQIMKKSLRAHDAIGRIGGEEFAIMLPLTEAHEALRIIERLRKSVMETPCPYLDKSGAEKTISYTASFGLVAVTSGVWTVDHLFVKADENLYQAKGEGRNRTIMQELKAA